MSSKRSSKLKMVKERTEAEKKNWAEENDRWETAETQLLITAAEAKKRVHNLRDELEKYRSQIEGVPFDILTGDFEPPICLGNSHRKHTVELLDDLDPRLDARFEMINSYAEQHGCHESLDFQSRLYELRTCVAEAAFRAGVLAGVIFAGCSNEQVNRFERGLAFSLASDSRVVKSRD